MVTTASGDHIQRCVACTSCGGFLQMLKMWKQSLSKPTETIFIEKVKASRPPCYPELTKMDVSPVCLKCALDQNIKVIR